MQKDIIKDTTVKITMTLTMEKVNLPEAELKCVLMEDTEQYVMTIGTMKMPL